jgi:glycogen debranching enzyme
VEAHQRFLRPLLRHLDEAGLGHISEIADGDAPRTPRGCPFQAWSVGEAIRLDRVVLASPVGPGPGDSGKKTRTGRNRSLGSASKKAITTLTDISVRRGLVDGPCRT